MSNPRLNEEQMLLAGDILERVRGEIEKLSGGNAELRFAYRRRIMTQLQYDERGKPKKRLALKKGKWKEQKGLCSECKGELGEGAALNCMSAPDGFTWKNTRLICKQCNDESPNLDIDLMEEALDDVLDDDLDDMP